MSNKKKIQNNFFNSILWKYYDTTYEFIEFIELFIDFIEFVELFSEFIEFIKNFKFLMPLITKKNSLFFKILFMYIFSYHLWKYIEFIEYFIFFTSFKLKKKISK